MNFDTAIPCGLIINELISNALKHAFPEGRKGQIKVELIDNDSNISLVVSDDGIGFSEDIEFKNTKTLGLQLVCIMTQQLKGQITLDKHVGTRFRIVFPKVKSMLKEQ
jgi:two-component sensor histidine kinase